MFSASKPILYASEPDYTVVKKYSYKNLRSETCANRSYALEWKGGKKIRALKSESGDGVEKCITKMSESRGRSRDSHS